jgi:hypothetical protein
LIEGGLQVFHDLSRQVGGVRQIGGVPQAVVP